MKTTSKLIIIGGGEARKPDSSDSENGSLYSENILNKLIQETQSNNPKIVILPFASKEQDKVEIKYKTAFKKLGYEVDVLKASQKSDVDQEKHLKIIRSADVVFLTGGSHFTLKKIIAETELFKIIKERYHNEAIVLVGTSAGGMIMSDCMIISGKSDASVIKGNIETGPGLGLIKNIIIDTHFMNRGRFARLILALMQKKDMIGVGICEDTAVVVYNNNEMQAIGSGTVTIVDMHDVNQSNYPAAAVGTPLFIENLRVHILAEGSSYLMKEKVFKVL